MSGSCTHLKAYIWPNIHSRNKLDSRVHLLDTHYWLWRYKYYWSCLWYFPSSSLPFIIIMEINCVVMKLILLFYRSCCDNGNACNNLLDAFSNILCWCFFSAFLPLGPEQMQDSNCRNPKSRHVRVPI